MTDARYPERWLHDRRFRTLPAQSHVTYVLTLALAVGNRSEGLVTRDDLDHLHRSHEDADVLVIAGLWDVELNGAGWQIVDFHGTQTTRAEFEAADAARKRERERKAEQRRRKAESAGRDDGVPGDRAGVPGDVPADGGGVSGDYTGQASASARPGALDASTTRQGGQQTDWPPVAVPGRGAA